MGLADVGPTANGEAPFRSPSRAGDLGKPVSFMADKEAMANPIDTLAFLNNGLPAYYDRGVKYSRTRPTVLTLLCLLTPNKPASARATECSDTMISQSHTLKGNGGVAEPWISGGSMLKPHAIYGVQNTCHGYTVNDGMPIVAVPPAMQSVDQKHGMANSSDRPPAMQTDIAAEVEYDFDNPELCEEGTDGMLGVLNVEL